MNLPGVTLQIAIGRSKGDFNSSLRSRSRRLSLGKWQRLEAGEQQSEATHEGEKLGHGTSFCARLISRFLSLFKRRNKDLNNMFTVVVSELAPTGSRCSNNVTGCS